MPGGVATQPLRTIRRSSYAQCTFANFPVSHWNKIREPIPNPYKVTNRSGDGESYELPCRALTVHVRSGAMCTQKATPAKPTWPRRR